MPCEKVPIEKNKAGIIRKSFFIKDEFLNFSMLKVILHLK
jgi:hypothetical protein